MWLDDYLVTCAPRTATDQDGLAGDDKLRGFTVVGNKRHDGTAVVLDWLARAVLDPQLTCTGPRRMVTRVWSLQCQAFYVLALPSGVACQRIFSCADRNARG